MRLFTSNSNIRLIFGIILLNAIITVLVSEYFYIGNNIEVYRGMNNDKLVYESKLSKKKTLFILGDSRAKAGIIPELIDSATNYDSYNIGLDGIYRGYLVKLESNNVYPDKIIVAVSPFSIFKNYNIKKNPFSGFLDDKLYNSLLVLRTPNLYSEKYINSVINKYTHLHYGFSDVADVLKYGKVSGYYTSKGWHGYDRLGSDEFYTYMINIESYKNKIIEEYKYPSKIKEGKQRFEDIVKSMQSDNISVLFVRIPTSKELRMVEDKKYPWFSNYINEISRMYNYDYVEFNNFNYPQNEVDGSHLNKNSANEFTKELIKHLK